MLDKVAKRWGQKDQQELGGPGRCQGQSRKQGRTGCPRVARVARKPCGVAARGCVPVPDTSCRFATPVASNQFHPAVAPLETGVAPSGTGGAPSGGQVAPSGTGEAPLETGVAPLETVVAALETGGVPLETGGAPLETGGAPSGTWGAPLGTGGAPLVAGEAPLCTWGAPLWTGGAPSGTGGASFQHNGGLSWKTVAVCMAISILVASNSLIRVRDGRAVAFPGILPGRC